MAEAKAYSAARLAEANAQQQALKLKADARLDSSKLRSQGVLAEADAENEQALNLDAKRKFEQRMKMNDSL